MFDAMPEKKELSDWAIVIISISALLALVSIVALCSKRSKRGTREHDGSLLNANRTGSVSTNMSM